MQSLALEFTSSWVKLGLSGIWRVWGGLSYINFPWGQESYDGPKFWI